MSIDLNNHSSLTIRAILLVTVLIMYPAPSMADSFSILQERGMPLSGSAVDITVSNDGQYTFVLTSVGEVVIYRGTGDLVQTLKVGKGFDSVQYSPAGNRLILGGSGKQELRILTLSMLYELDYKGSPFKGPANAPVTIAVFDDFQ